MKKSILVLLAAAAAVPLFAAPQMDDEAAAYIKTLIEKGKNYRRRLDKTYFFTRGQLKYGLERKDYLRRWSDRPLMQESGFAEKGSNAENNYDGKFSENGFINHNTYIAESKLLEKFHFAGFAFFATSSGRLDILNHAGAPGTGNIKLFGEVTTRGLSNPARAQRVHDYAKRALKNKHVFRANGKIVVTSYPASDEKTIPLWVRTKEEFKKLYGDNFLFVPYVSLRLPPTGKNNTYTKADIVKMENRLRNYLRVLDGFYHNSPPFRERRYYWEMDRELLIPIIHSVMSEAEFKDKLLIWGTKVGHMNCHRQSYGIDAFNTDTLRGTVGAAVLAKADMINCVEWDEENENTSFRPMTMTGFSTLRICRAFEQMANSGKFSPLPGDDLSIPNVVLSYPRVVVAGQLIEVEVANIPDNSRKEAMQVSVGFKDNNGKIVWQSETRKLDHASVCAEVFNIQSEKVIEHRFLNPFVTVDGKCYDDGFYPLEVRSWWHWDYLYAKHVLRDMPKGVKVDFGFSKPDKHGLTDIKVKVSSPEDIRSIEIITGDNVVIYSHDKNGVSKFRESAERAAFRISLQGAHGNVLMLNGKVKLLNAPELDRFPMPGKRSKSQSKHEWIFDNFSLTSRPIHYFISIPRKDLDNAALEVDLPGITKQKTIIKLADIQNLGSYSIAGKHSSQFAVVRNNQQEVMPDVLGGKNYEFTVPVRADAPEAGYLVQVIDRNYRMYRSKKVSPFTLSGEKVKYGVVSVGSNTPGVAEADKALLKPLTYDFSDRNGAILKSSLGSRFDGILSGHVPLATGFGWGESGYGNSIAAEYLRRGKILEYAYPTREKIDGQDALVFKGGQYVSLPIGIVPAFGSYEIEMDVYVDKKDGTQTLLTGTQKAFTFSLKNRVPVMRIFCNGIAGGVRSASGPRLKPWHWNKVKVRFNQRELVVSVNGVSGKPVKVHGYQRYPRATVIGASERGEFFHGKIRNFKITPHAL